MQETDNIQIIKNREIDKAQWDECVEHSLNNLIYAKTFYLDNIASGWDALTGENYEWVLPITYKRKYGISYLYQPAFTQQLGVFAKRGVTVPYQQIIHYLQQHYRFWEISFNGATSRVHLTTELLQINSANNFVLNLSGNFESIAANYHNDLIKNLKRSKQFQQIYKATNDYKKCIHLYKEHYGKRMPHVKETDYKNFSQICFYAQQSNMLICREVVNERGALMAAALLLFDGKRMYNLMNTTLEAGRKTAANHFLLNAIIEEFSGSDIVFDFEGSDLPGVKTFYENFGAVNQPYQMIKYNRLPWPLNILKN